MVSDRYFCGEPVILNVSLSSMSYSGRLTEVENEAVKSEVKSTNKTAWAWRPELTWGRVAEWGAEPCGLTQCHTQQNPRMSVTGRITCLVSVRENPNI